MSHKPRTSLSLDQRKCVIELKEKGVPVRVLMEKFKCGKSQVCAIIKNKTEILKEWEAAENRNKKRKRELKFHDVDDSIFQWFQCVRATDCLVTGPMIQQKARQIAQELRISGFTASNGWLDSFRKRHNITFPRRDLLEKNNNGRGCCQNEESREKSAGSDSEMELGEEAGSRRRVRGKPEKRLKKRHEKEIQNFMIVLSDEDELGEEAGSRRRGRGKPEKRLKKRHEKEIQNFMIVLSDEDEEMA